MKSKGRSVRCRMAFVAASLVLLTGAGCVEAVIGSLAGAFGAGFVAGAVATPVQQRCYVNGEQVDCSTIDLAGLTGG